MYRPLFLALILLLLPNQSYGQKSNFFNQFFKQADVKSNQVLLEEDNNLLILRGNVRISYKFFNLFTDELTVHQEKALLSTHGKTTLELNALHLLLPLRLQTRSLLGATVSLETEDPLYWDQKNKSLRTGAIKLFTNNRKLFLESLTVENRTLSARDIIFACCKDNGQVVWQITAQKLTQDHTHFTFHKLQARFLNWPITLFSKPTIRVPNFTRLKGRGATGVLPPHVKRSPYVQFMLGIPYYVALSPSKDLTVIPWLSPRAPLIEIEARKRFPHGSTQTTLTSTLAPVRQQQNDFKTFGARPNNQFRHHIKSQGNFSLQPTLSYKWQLYKVSHKDYLEDFLFDETARMLTSFLQVNTNTNTSSHTLSLSSFQDLRKNPHLFPSSTPFLLLYQYNTIRPLLKGYLNATLNSSYQRVNTSTPPLRELTGTLRWSRQQIQGPFVHTTKIATKFLHSESHTKIFAALLQSLSMPLLEKRSHWILSPQIHLFLSSTPPQNLARQHKILHAVDTPRLLSLESYLNGDLRNNTLQYALNFHKPQHFNASAALVTTLKTQGNTPKNHLLFNTALTASPVLSLESEVMLTTQGQLLRGLHHATLNMEQYKITAQHAFLSHTTLALWTHNLQSFTLTSQYDVSKTFSLSLAFAQDKAHETGKRWTVGLFLLQNCLLFQMKVTYKQGDLYQRNKGMNFQLSIRPKFF